MPELIEINDALLELERELEKLKDSVTLIDETREAAQRVTEVADSVRKSVNDLAGSMVALCSRLEILTDKLDKVDFPTRLDKIDATISNISAAIQNVQSRFESMERNIKDSIDARHEEAKSLLTKAHADTVKQLSERVNKKVESAQQSISNVVLSQSTELKDALTEEISKSGKSIIEEMKINRYVIIVVGLFALSSLLLHIFLR